MEYGNSPLKYHIAQPPPVFGVIEMKQINDSNSNRVRQRKRRGVCRHVICCRVGGDCLHFDLSLFASMPG